MAARARTQILDEMAKGYGKQGRLSRKLAVNRDRNWLLAIVLNSFAKLATGAELTDLDYTIIQAFRAEGFNDDQLKEHGRLYQTLSDQSRRTLFPDKFSGFTPDTEYKLADLTSDLPSLSAAVLAMPNAVDIDVGAVHAGAANLADFPTPSRTVVRAHSGGLVRAVEANVTPPNPTYTIKATKFHCSDETGWDGLGSDEPYWIFGSLGAGIAVTTRSRIFEDVDSGDTFTFDANDGCIWGQDCTPQDLPEGEIGTLIQLWEHDYGDPTAVKAGVAAAFAAAAGILAATGVAAWVAAIVAGVGAVVQWLLGFLDDDHIADQTFVFSRQTIVSQLQKVGQSFDVTRQFTDGDGDYTLTITVSRAS